MKTSGKSYRSFKNLAPAMKRYALTEQEFSAFESLRDWEIREIPFEEAKAIPHLPRRDDVLAAYASGCLNSTKVLNGVEAIFGMDVIAIERRPNVLQREPDLNIYHCVVQKLKKPHNGYHYLMYGPSESDTLFGHWKDDAVLDDYIKVARVSEIEERPGGLTQQGECSFRLNPMI